VNDRKGLNGLIVGLGIEELNWIWCIWEN